MKKYKRICRICGKELEYGSYSAYYLAEKNNAVCRNCATRKNAKRKCDLSPLLEETPEAYYWIGFLLADGHFENGRIKFHLALRDAEQIRRFASFIKWTGNFENRGKLGIGVAAKHTEVVEMLCDKFDIKQDKTYDPPNTILNHDKELLKCLLIGFIDGDGNIENQYKRKDCFIRIKVHKSWNEILKEFCELVDYDTKHVRLNNKGYCELYFSDSNIVTELKKKSNELPVLDRKWKKIDEDYISRHNTSKILKEKIIKMLNENMRNKDISNELGVSTSYISKINKEYVKRRF
jgi:ferredoxin-thioredoxin reductase catalytic subunit